ncbi:adenylate/guanylate cyclase domain-containing protein [Roseivirga sp.]|uniref:adenylate/guanylate cyclase domain-containing protein n=1 Tax=Roseivirga sp. TaxID=1964215 RepID=UPI003B8C41DD
MMVLSPKRKNFLLSWITYVIIFVIGGLLFYNVERGLLGGASFYPSTKNPYDAMASGVSIILGSMFMGAVIGYCELTLFRFLLSNKTFLFKIASKVLLYAAFLTSFIILLSLPINALALEQPLFHQDVLDTVRDFTSNYAFWSAMIHCAAFITLSLFIKEMIDNIGISQVKNFFTGKYHSSKEETRVFMFLDMKDSTTIAEQMGHERYYRFLNRYYRDMTRPIVATEGEIYQYIGDEIVISWEGKAGLINSNCLACFFGIQEAIEKNRDYYINTFGQLPAFKAGIHIGQVTRGEVGVLKKELLFTGDTINVTARIQSLCNELESQLLVSEDLLNKLEQGNDYQVTSKGEYSLRGRDQTIELFHLKQI